MDRNELRVILGEAFTKGWVAGLNAGTHLRDVRMAELLESAEYEQERTVMEIIKKQEEAHGRV